MGKKKLNQLIEVSSIGKRKYILKYGVLIWVFIMALIFSVKSFITNDNIDEVIIEVVIALVIWPVAGLFYGLLSWHLNQRYIKKHINRE